jgi:hypothetical protein
MANNIFSIKTNRTNSSSSARGDPGKNRSNANKIGKIGKNIIKSAGKLTVDVVGAYVPELKSFASNAAQAKRDVATDINRSISSIKNAVSGVVGNSAGGAEANPINFLKTSIKGSFDETVNQLKQGNFYRRSEDNIDAGSSFGFDDLDDIMGDMGSIQYGDPETTLSDEPFGQPSTSVEKKIIEGTIRNTQRKRRRKGNSVKRSSSSPVNELTLGDKFLSETGKHIATAIIGKQESVFKSQYAADEIRHRTIINYHENLIKSVDAVVNHLQNIEGKNVEDAMEFRSSVRSFQEENLSLLRDIKENLISSSSSGIGSSNKIDNRSALSKILSGSNSLNMGEYGKNVKNNLMDIAYSTPLGPVLGLAPMLNMFLGMGGEMGVKQKFDPLSMLIRAGANSLISGPTRGKLASINETFGNMGTLFTGRMNELARFGKSPLTKTIGKILGVKGTYAKKNNLGLQDPNLKVDWTAKSDRTLNEVIPEYLSKIASALTGKEETFYDYSIGRFRNKSSIEAEQKRVRENAMYDPFLDKNVKEMRKVGQQYSSVAKSTTDKKSWDIIEKDIETIQKNISFSKMPFNPENVQDSSYRRQLLSGVKDEKSLTVFTEMFQKMGGLRQQQLNSAALRRGINYEESILNYNDELIKNGGASALQRANNKEERERLQYELEYSHGLKINKNDNKLSLLYKQKQRDRADVLKRIEALSEESGEAYPRGSGLDLSSVGNIYKGQKTDRLNDIYKLLSQGIIVFPQGFSGGKMPKHLKDIGLKFDKEEKERIRREREREELEKIRSGEKKGLNEEITDINKEQKDIERTNRFMKYMSLGEIFNTVAGTSKMKILNPVNQGLALSANVVSGGLNKFLGIKESDSGLFGKTEYENELDRVREASENAKRNINSRRKRRKQEGKSAHIEDAVYKYILTKQKNNKNAFTLNDIGVDEKTGISNKLNAVIEGIRGTGENIIGSLRSDGASGKFSGVDESPVIKTASSIKDDSANAIKNIKVKDPGKKEEIIDLVNSKNINSYSKRQELIDFIKSKKIKGLNKKEEIINFLKSYNIKDKVSKTVEQGIPFSLSSFIPNVKESVSSNTGGIIKRKSDIERSALSIKDEMKGYIDSQLPKVQGALIAYLGKAKSLLSREEGIVEGSGFNIGKGINIPELGNISPVVDKIGSVINEKIKGLFKQEETQDEDDENVKEHKTALLTYKILEDVVKEVVSEKKEPSFKDIDNAVNKRVREGKIDKDIANAVMSKAKKIAGDKDKDANPLNAYYSAIYEMKESYNKKYRKENSVAKKIVKKIAKGGVKPIAATTLLLTGHPIMAAMLAFGPKKVFGGVKGGIKGAIKGSKVLAGAAVKITALSARMAPGIMKTGLGLVGNILTGDFFGSKPKKTRNEIEEERKVASLAFKTLEEIQQELMEAKPDASLSNIKSAINRKVKSGTLDGEIAEAIIKATEKNYKDKDADATPMGAFVQAILTLKKQYSKQYRKDTNVFRKIAGAILKGAGQGIGAASLLLAGHPILASALALRGPARLFKSINNKIKGKKDKQTPAAAISTPEQRQALEDAKYNIQEKTESIKTGLIKKLPNLALGGPKAGLSKARNVIGNTFGNVKDKVGEAFSGLKREGSFEDYHSDKKEEKQEKIQDETLEVLKDIRDNTFDTEQEKLEKDKRQSEMFKKLGISDGDGKDSGSPGSITGLLGGLATSAIGALIKGKAGSLLASAAGKGGVLGKAASFAGKILGTGKTGAAAANAAKAVNAAGKLGSAGGKAAGLLGKVGGLAGKLGGLGGKAAGLLGKAGGLGSKAAGLLGKAGGLAKFAGPALGSVAKFAGPVGLGIMAAQALGGGLKGWKNAGSIAGLGEGENATTGQKVGSALSGGLSAMSMGLIKPEQIYNAGKGIKQYIAGKKEYEKNFDGTIKYDENGQPIEKKRSLLGKIGRGAMMLSPAGGFIAGAKLLEQTKIGKSIKNKLYGEEKPVLDVYGNPVLDPSTGEPMMEREGERKRRLRGRGSKSVDFNEKFEKVKKAAADKGIDIEAGSLSALMSRSLGGDGNKDNKEENPIDKAIERSLGITDESKQFLEKNKTKITGAASTIFKFTPIGMAMEMGKKIEDLSGNSGEKMKGAAMTIFDMSPLGMALKTPIGKKIGDKIGGIGKKVSNFFGNVFGKKGDDGSYSSESGPGIVQRADGSGGQDLKKLDVLKLKDPKEAAAYFKQNASKAGKEVKALLDNRNFDELEDLEKKIKDPMRMGQNKHVDSLSPEFRKRVQSFLDSPEARAKNVKIRESVRSPLTQLAYYFKGRTSNIPFLNKAFKSAGLGEKAWDPEIRNTETLGSEHFSGNAVDFEDNGRGASFYNEIAPVAKRYGLEWGGDWRGWKDPPHFQLPRNDDSIGYRGPPQGADSNDSSITQRADGSGSLRARGAASLRKESFIGKGLKRLFGGENKEGSTISTALRLKESPVVTNDKILIEQINEAINIQKMIQEEQVRHNTVSEDFYNTMLELVKTIATASIGALKNNQRSSMGSIMGRTGSSPSNIRNELLNLSKNLLMKNARIMAEG